MKLRTYRANSMAEALAQVKRDLGADAVILHTRTRKHGGWLGFGAREVVEIIASDDVRVAERPPAGGASGQPVHNITAGRPPRSGPPGVTTMTRAAMDAYAGGSGTTRDPARPVAPSREPELADAGVMRVRRREAGATPSDLATPVTIAPVDAAAARELHKELDSIKQMVGHVLRSSGSDGPGSMPETLFNLYLRLLEAEVGRELADGIVAGVRDELTPDELTDADIVRQTVLRRLAGYIAVAPGVGNPARRNDRPLTIALIGPTGVGKTTTIAKLAASYKLRHAKRVGLITSDTYRIAAVDQLRTYANIIGIKLEVVLTPAEMASACESLSDCDVILIDTAGRSQHNTERLDELATFLDAADPHETHLVLSSTASEKVLRKIVDRFGVAKPDHLIFTKLDEAVSFGVFVNIARHVDASLSFVTTGQEVPDHIEPGHPDRLARMILDGRLLAGAGDE